MSRFNVSFACIRHSFLSIIFAIAVLLCGYIVHTTYERQQSRLTFNQINKKHRILLFIGILSKLSAVGRRNSIRITWLDLCKQRGEVKCVFFTDKRNAINPNDHDDEEKHGDLIHMPFAGAMNFSQRLIWMMIWASKRFNFDFFLRIDDDHYLCLDRLLFELPKRPNIGLYWGYIHCRPRIVRVDEGWLMLSSDLVLEALSKVNKSLQCHPYGDQAVALWIGESSINVTYFYDNDRIIHTATSFNPSKYLKTDICDNYLSLHGTYPEGMQKYWILDHHLYNLRRVRKQRTYKIDEIDPFERHCSYSKRFDVNGFLRQFRFQPKLCKDNPSWKRLEFNSREDAGGARA